MKRFFISIVLIGFLFWMVMPAANAEVVILKNGQRLEGKILARTTQFIILDIGVGVDLTYYLETIESIDGFKIVSQDGVFVSLDPEEEINQNAEAIAIDIEPEERSPTSSDPSQTAVQTTDLTDLSTQDNDTEGLDVRDKMREYKNFEKINQVKQIFKSINIDPESKLFPVILFIVSSIFFLLLWFLSCYPLVLMAKKIGTSHAWMGWVPLLQVFLFIRMAGVSFWWIILLFIPLVNFFIPLVLWFKIAEALNKPTWIAFLMYIPLVNYFALWYLALAKVEVQSPPIL